MTMTVKKREYLDSKMTLDQLDKAMSELFPKHTQHLSLIHI